MYSNTQACPSEALASYLPSGLICSSAFGSYYQKSGHQDRIRSVGDILGGKWRFKMKRQEWWEECHPAEQIWLEKRRQHMKTSTQCCSHRVVPQQQESLSQNPWAYVPRRGQCYLPQRLVGGNWERVSPAWTQQWAHGGSRWVLVNVLEYSGDPRHMFIASVPLYDFYLATKAVIKKQKKQKKYRSSPIDLW